MTRRHTTTTVPLIGIVLLVIVSAFVFSRQNGGSFLTEPTPSPRPVISCPKTGPLNKNDYLPTYTVVEGDTLQNIAEKQLRDKTRDLEIIHLNEERYAGLQGNTPFIEIGWKLALPPKESTKTNGYIFAVGGAYTKQRDGWSVEWTEQGTSVFSKQSFPEGIEDGTCVILVYQENDPATKEGLQLFTIAKQ